MRNRWNVFRSFCRVLPVTVALGGVLAAQVRASAPAPASVAAPALNDKDVAATQAELIRLLRLSPTLTTVVSHDPSLLANQEYVARNNPQLAAFLGSHPEVARNPDFYLFTHMHVEGQPDEALERAIWPDLYRAQDRPSAYADFMSNMPPVIALAAFLAAVVWLTRFFLENRRWQRIFKLQSEVHGRLIDKFNSTQELAAYMETEAGKRFLEAAPIPVNLETGQQVPNAVARVLTPLQIGIVLVLLGAGLMMLRNASEEMSVPMLVLGTVVLMPGIGFILSAGVTWVLAARLGILPPRPSGQGDSGSPHNAAKDRL
jgi:hypothetical protein